MFYYLLGIVTLLSLVGSIVVSILYWRGNRLFKSREQREIEEGLQKTFGKDTRWGVFGGADNEIHNNHYNQSHHSSHGHSSDSHHSDGGSHDSSSGD